MHHKHIKLLVEKTIEKAVSEVEKTYPKREEKDSQAGNRRSDKAV